MENEIVAATEAAIQSVLKAFYNSHFNATSAFISDHIILRKAGHIYWRNPECKT